MGQVFTFARVGVREYKASENVIPDSFYNSNCSQ